MGGWSEGRREGEKERWREGEKERWREGGKGDVAIEEAGKEYIEAGMRERDVNKRK